MGDKALITLFSEQLKKEVEILVSENNLENKGQGLTWWYFKKIKPLTDDEIEDAVCDGGGDLGIDAIIKDDYDVVHFYQFKNQSNPDRGYPTGEVDKTIAGLEIIIRRQHDKIANEKLKAKINEVLETIPTGYQIHFVSTGSGLEHDAKVKVQAFIASLNPPSADYFMSFNENIDYLQDVFYTKSLPTLDKVIELPVDNMPYMVRTADHDSYSFHLSGQELAALYEEHGEKILQQNIRMFEGGNPTNEAINRSCTGDDSANFYHYNNGVSILCESAKWDAFKKCIELKKPQIVNGGQTVRVLSQAKLDGELKDNVLVPVRIITSQGNKEFAGNVAVNLNNQTRVQGQFLKSNNPKIVQLAASLKALDWYLERREGEIEELTKEEREKIEASINGPLSEKTIPLKEGTQAYAATFYGNPGLARLNPAKMFIDVSDGGQFNRIFSESLSADNFAKAYMLYRAVDQKVSEFKRIKRRKAYDSDWKEHYEKILGKEFVDSRLSVLDDIVPQSTLFVIGICYQWYILKQGYTFEQLIEEIETLPEAINFALDQIVETQEASGDKWNKSWQSLLKNQKFFEDIIQNLGL